jgi:hypothetical protein
MKVKVTEPSAVFTFRHAALRDIIDASSSSQKVSSIEARATLDTHFGLVKLSVPSN